jgi:hypothetical protein
MPFRDSKITGGKVRIKTSMTSGETIGSSGLSPGEIALQAADGRLLYRDASGALQGFPAGEGINKIVAIAQTSYDAITPSPTTLYVITD